jgi:hypothetical protein
MRTALPLMGERRNKLGISPRIFQHPCYRYARQGADRDRTLRVDHLSPQTSHRLDNCHCAGRAKDSDEPQVALHRRKTTTKRSQRREHDQLPHPRVHLQDTFHFALILEARRPPGLGDRRPGLAMIRRAAGHDHWNQRSSLPLGSVH